MSNNTSNINHDWRTCELLTIPKKPELATTRLMIYSVNDIYELDNLPYVKTLMDQHRSLVQADQVVVTMNGDFLSPSTLSLFDKGSTMCKAMNELGITHLCFGNHEFDIDYRTISKRVQSLQGQLINSNISFNEAKIAELNAKLPPWETPKASAAPAPTIEEHVFTFNQDDGGLKLQLDGGPEDTIQTPVSTTNSPSSSDHGEDSRAELLRLRGLLPTKTKVTSDVPLSSLCVPSAMTQVGEDSEDIRPNIHWRGYLTEETEANMVIASAGSASGLASLPFRIRPVLDAASEHMAEMKAPIVDASKLYDLADVSEAENSESTESRVDYAICLTHQYMPKDRQLAQLCPDFDLLLGGHEHEPFAELIIADDDSRIYARKAISTAVPKQPFATFPVASPTNTNTDTNAPESDGVSKPTPHLAAIASVPVEPAGDSFHTDRASVDTPGASSMPSFDYTTSIPIQGEEKFDTEESKGELVRSASTTSPHLRRRLSSVASSVAAEIYDVNAPETAAPSIFVPSGSNSDGVTDAQNQEPEEHAWQEQRRMHALNASVQSSGVSLIKAGSDGMYLAMITIDFIYAPAVGKTPEEIEAFIRKETQQGDARSRTYLSKTIRRHKGSPFIVVTYMQMANIGSLKCKGALTPCAALSELVDVGKSIIAKQAGKVVYEQPAHLPMLSSKNVRSGPSTMATFLASRVRGFFQCDVAVLPSGKIRGNKDYPTGKLTFVDILGELPFPDNQTVLIHIDGKSIEDTIRFSRVNYRGRGGFLHTDAGTQYSDELGRLTSLADVAITDANRDTVLTKCYWMACPITHLKGMDNLPGLKIAGCDNGIEDLKNEEDLLLLQHIVMRSLSDDPQENRAGAEEKLRATPALTPHITPRMTGHAAPCHCNFSDQLGVPGDFEL